MIDFGKILKRAWHILWNYKVLWIFGILLALTGGNGGDTGLRYQFSSNGRENGYGPGIDQLGRVLREFNLWAEQNLGPLFQHPEEHISTFIWIGVGLLLFFLLGAVIMTFVRYVSETAILRMVDEYEQTGTKVGFKQGWKLGWSRRAFRIWVIDLVISLPAILFIALLVGLAALFFFSVESGNNGLAFGGAIAAIGCAFLFLFAFIILMVLVYLGLFRQFFVRSAALEDAGIGESFRRGWAMFKRNWKSAALMWLIMLGLRIGFSIVGIILFFLLIPAYIITGIAGLIVAAIPGLIAFGITSIFASGPLTWIIGILVALPFFVLVLFLPLTLISGWYLIYESSAWTLAYREMKALENIAPAEVPEKTA
jgi:hypothetical protein